MIGDLGAAIFGVGSGLKARRKPKGVGKKVRCCSVSSMILSGDRPPNEKIISALYTCPNTGARVQGWIADDGSKDGSETYEGNSGDAVNGLCAADDARA